MLVIWGRRVKRIKMGRYADFCPICRTISAHRITRLDSARHVYYIPIESVTVVTEQCCEACGTRLYQPGEFVHDVSFKKHLQLEELIQKTNPDVRTAHAERLRLESRLRNIDVGTRSRLIREPFEVLRGHVLSRVFNLPIGPLLAILVVLVVSTIILESFGKGELAPTVCALVAVSFILARYIRVNRAVRPIVRALVPLQPSLEELDEAIADVVHRDSRLRRHFNAQKIYGEIQNAPVWHSADGVPMLRND